MQYQSYLMILSVTYIYLMVMMERFYLKQERNLNGIRT